MLGKPEHVDLGELLAFDPRLSRPMETLHDVFEPREDVVLREGGKNGVYATKNEAAVAGLTQAFARSVLENREYAGQIYQRKDGTYGTTGAVHGTTASSQPLDAPIPKGTHAAAYWHTHGGNDPKYDGERFSKADGDFVRAHHHPLYVITPTMGFGVIRQGVPHTTPVGGVRASP
jgi:hypothetical protein